MDLRDLRGTARGWDLICGGRRVCCTAGQGPPLKAWLLVSPVLSVLCYMFIEVWSGAWMK